MTLDLATVATFVAVAIGWVLAYWTIRLAVRHAIRDTKEDA